MRQISIIQLNETKLFDSKVIFFYIKDPESKNFEIATYNLKLTFSVSRASPFILAAILTLQTGKFLDEEPLSPQIRENLFGHNPVTGCSTETEAIETFQRSRTIVRDAAKNLLTGPPIMK